jgi:hypothetical protein
LGHDAHQGYYEETMKKLIRIATPLIAVAMMTSPMIALAQSSQTGNATQNNSTDWSAPPAGTEQAQAYRDGVEAAQLDKAANRKIDPTASYLYNHPKVKKDQRDAYRSSFVQGYQAALKHNSGM